MQKFLLMVFLGIAYAGENALLGYVEIDGGRQIKYKFGGVQYKSGSAIYFRSETKLSRTMLYGTMVSILSDEYGCFMVRRIDFQTLTRFDCRDGRKVVFSRIEAGFMSNQYDNRGELLVVENGRILRIGH